METLTGRGVTVAVIDSGVQAAHPHIGGIAGGISLGEEDDSYTDVLGHGTAVMAAINEKAPDAEYFAVRVFQRSLRTSVDVLLRAIEWCVERRIQVVNLSLGTVNPAHAERFAPLVERARAQGTVLVSAYDVEGTPSFPGSLPGVIGVRLDWDLPRESYSCSLEPGGMAFAASGYPRPIPGVPPQRNLHGISFAVANMSGFVACARQRLPNAPYEEIYSALAAEAAMACKAADSAGPDSRSSSE
jgi:subtilisin family serine protease